MQSSLSPALLDQLQQIAHALQSGESWQQDEIDRLAATWRPYIAPAPAEEERFDVCDPHGEPTGVTAPRWLCHLLGLRHRATHILLRSPQDLLVLQVRSPTKADWPDHIDTSVGGHVRAGQSFLEAGLAEMEEELGLPADRLSTFLADGALTPVGEPYERNDLRPGIPPFRNRQVNQIFAGQLTPAGLTAIHFQDGEVSALYLCSDAEAQRLVEEGIRAAPGLVHSLPRYLAWRGGRPPPSS